MKVRENIRVLSMQCLVWTVVLSTAGWNLALSEEDKMPTGETPLNEVPIEWPPGLCLLSGKLFRVQGNESATSDDNGKTWQRGGEISSYKPYGKLAHRLDEVAIQLQSGKHKGRILVPYYLAVYGNKHPDYNRKQRGGYAIWRGKKILLETHTHVPELAGSYVCFSDDEGKTWQVSEGFMVGYINDGHLGHWSCEEPVIAELKDGRVLCFMRSTCGRILKSYSEDGGKHWMKVQPTDIAMSNSPCALKRIPGTDDLVLVWNQMSAEEICKGYRRGRLSIAVSKDDGRTWENVKTLELVPGLEKRTWVEPPPLQPMVRGPSGPDSPMGVLLDGFKHYHYPVVALFEDKIFIRYPVSPPAGGSGGFTQRRVFPISWLYESVVSK